MAYSDKVLDHYENPRNVGSMDKSDPKVKFFEAGKIHDAGEILLEGRPQQKINHLFSCGALFGAFENPRKFYLPEAHAVCHQRSRGRIRGRLFGKDNLRCRAAAV